MKNRRLLVVALYAGLIFAGPSEPTNAGTLTTTMPVTLSAVSGCTLSATGVNFGSIAISNGTYNLNSGTGTVTVNCANGLPYAVTLDDGDQFTFAGGRHLGNANGASLVPYELYKDAALTQVWGDSGHAGLYLPGTPLTATGTGSPTVHTVYGKLLPGGQTNLPPTLTDNIVVTLFF